MKTHTLLPALIFSAAFMSTASAASYVYDIQNDLGAGINNTAITDAGWEGNGTWQTRAFDGYYFATLTNGSNVAGTPHVRTLARDLSSVLNASNTSLTLDIKVRIDGDANYKWSSGIADGTTMLLGIQKNGLDWEIVQNGIVSTTKGGFVSASNGTNYVSLVVDYGAGTVDLMHGATKLINDYALDPTLTAAYVANNADGLQMGMDTSYYVGTGSFTIDTVPEPSSSALLGLAGMALVLRRRR
ncbi:MAG: PEP-CTERM sorting domain-containing protein [Akkermansiaceae bacterium]|nr:PEP-CTERM sorting domain-containing protein [Akkermansiaceae bacterium]